MKRLYRSRKDRMIFGVAGGLAEYFQVDPVLVRLLWVLAVLVGGWGLPAYIIAAIIIPEEPKYERVVQGQQQGPSNPESTAPEEEQRSRLEAVDRSGSGQKLFGYILIATGVYLLAQRVFPWWFAHLWWLSPSRIWPLILIAVGVAMIVRGISR